MQPWSLTAALRSSGLLGQALPAPLAGGAAVWASPKSLPEVLAGRDPCPALPEEAAGRWGAHSTLEDRNAGSGFSSENLSAVHMDIACASNRAGGLGMEGPGGHHPSPSHRISPLSGVTGGHFGWKNILLYQEKPAGNNT